MSRQFDVAEADRFHLNARLGQPVQQKHIDALGPVRIWRPIGDDGRLDMSQLVLPLSSRKGWIWWCEGDPWATFKDHEAIDLLVAVCASSGSSVGGRSLFLFETNEPEAFMRWKHLIMAEGIRSVIGYLASYEYWRSSRARAALDTPMNDPQPPTPEVRRLYDGALHYAKMSKLYGRPVPWPKRSGSSSLPECHWQKWPIQHVLVAGVGHGWAR